MEAAPTAAKDLVAVKDVPDRTSVKRVVTTATSVMHSQPAAIPEGLKGLLVRGERREAPISAPDTSNTSPLHSSHRVCFEVSEVSMRWPSLCTDTSAAFCDAFFRVSIPAKGVVDHARTVCL